MSSPKNTTTIRFQLTCLVVACVLPLWLMAGYLLFQSYSTKLNKAKTDMLETARDAVTDVDRELSLIQATLFALATSPSFDKADFAAIHRQAVQIAAPYPGGSIAVADANGQQLLNSSRPYGARPASAGSATLVRVVFATGRPAFSNLFFDPDTRRPLVAVHVPVVRAGRVAYDLSMTFSSQSMIAWLPRENLPQEWYCSVLDKNGIMAARTRQPEKYVGRRVTAALFGAVTGDPEGTTELTNMAGVRVLASYARSPMTGWTVAYGVPKGSELSDVYRWVSWAVGVCTLVSVIGILSAIHFAGRIAADIQSLVEPALAIGSGERTITVGSPRVRETAEVAEALVKASRLLRWRADERDRAERELSNTLEDLRRQTSERLRALEELRQKEQLLIQQSRQAALGEMIGNIAHQWRQPLNSLGLLVQQPPLIHDLGGLTREFLVDNAGRSMLLIGHMSRTIDDFRNFFKPEKEKVRFKVRDEVDKTLSLMEGSLNSKEIAIEVVADGEPEIEGYPNEFCQVLLNVLNNARDALVEHKVEAPKIVITIAGEGERTAVTVADNAGGIPEEIIGKVFDPYFTTKGPQLGTGVGLFMSKTIIEKNMGGLLSVRNADGGAEFRIVI